MDTRGLGFKGVMDWRTHWRTVPAPSSPFPVLPLCFEGLGFPFPYSLLSFALVGGALDCGALVPSLARPLPWPTP